MEEDEQEEEDDSQALSQEPLPEAPQEEDTAPAYLVRDSGIPPLRAVGMMKAMQLAGGDDYIQATLDADKRLGTDRLRLKVYSERTGGTARKERLKRKAADITGPAVEPQNLSLLHIVFLDASQSILQPRLALRCYKMLNRHNFTQA